MTVIKCKNCGGDIEISSSGIKECPHCKVRQTSVIPNSEKKVQVFNLAARLLYLNNYDKAYQLYSRLAEKFDEVEPYYGKVLCKYGVSFEDNELVCKKNLTTDVLDDEDYQHATDVATDEEFNFLELEAKKINKFQKEFNDVLSKETAFDIFISVDSSNKKSEDFMIAKEMYEVLKLDGKKVFFPSIALKGLDGASRAGKLYKAISTAKMYILFSSNQTRLNSDNVIKDINAYISAKSDDDSKKVILPCLKGIKEEYYPEAIKGLRVIDLSKDTFIDDIMDAVDANFKVKIEAPKPEQKAYKKALKALSEGNFNKAVTFSEEAININNKYDLAYETALFGSLKIKDKEELKNIFTPIYHNKYVLLAKDNEIELLDNYVLEVNENIYQKALSMPHNTIDEINAYTKVLSEIKDYKDAKELIDNAYGAKYEDSYEKAISLLEKGYLTKFERTLEEAINQLQTLVPYKDSEQKIVEAKAFIEQMNDDMFKKPYDEAIELYNKAKGLSNYAQALGMYVEANNILRKILSYKDAKEWNNKCREMMYNYSAMVIFKSEVVDEIKQAITVLNGLRPFKDSDTFITQGTAKVSDLLDPKKQKKKKK